MPKAEVKLVMERIRRAVVDVQSKFYEMPQFNDFVSAWQDGFNAAMGLHQEALREVEDFYLIQDSIEAKDKGTQSLEKMFKEQFKAGYEAARRDSIKHIRHAYALGQEVGRLEKLLEMHNDEDVRDSRHGDERSSSETMVEERSESNDTKKPERTERDGRWILHGYNDERPNHLGFNMLVDVLNENGTETVALKAGTVNWSIVHSWRLTSSNSTSRENEKEDAKSGIESS